MVQIIRTGEVTERPLTIRLCFQKTGALQYISHLDLTRTFSRVIQRTSLPVWYTQGFNPIPKMDFAAPISVGTESVCELLDVRVICPLDTDSVRDAFNEALPRELAVERVYYPERKFTDIAYSDYAVELTSPAVTADTADACRDLLARDEIIVFKKSKKGDHDENIKPFVKGFSFQGEAGKLSMRLTLACGKTRSIKPEYVIDYLVNRLSLFSGDQMHEYFSVKRTALYDEDFNLFK